MREEGWKKGRLQICASSPSRILVANPPKWRAAASSLPLADATPVEPGPLKPLAVLKQQLSVVSCPLPPREPRTDNRQRAAKPRYVCNILNACVHEPERMPC